MSDLNYRLILPESHIPTHWYNIQADLPTPLPPALHPGTKQPVGPDDFAPLFPMELIMQEVSQERYIPIPEELRDMYRLWRPTPLVRAVRLEKALDTPAHIYYKNESTSPSGSHKLNTALAQAYYNKVEGVSHLITETGAGQWGSALAIAGAFFDIDVEVFMVKMSYYQKPYRRSVMQAYGASVTPSPSTKTNAGRTILAQNPDSTGSLGIAISEAVEVAGKRPRSALFPGLCAEPRPAASDGDRPGSAGRHGTDRRVSRHRDRLRRRRLELRRAGLPVLARTSSPRAGAPASSPSNRPPAQR